MSHLNIILDIYEFSKTDQQGLISALELVSLPIDIDESEPLTQALHDFNNILQETFLRESGSERQQLSDKFLNQKENLVPLLSAFIKEVNSGNDCPSKILLGAAEKGVRERLDVLVDINNRGHYTEIVYPLGSEREL